MPLENYEISILLKMYDEKIIGKSGYKAIQQVRSKINWNGITVAYNVKKSFEAVARKLVKRMLLSDDGKSMKVLYLDKLGTSFVIGYTKQNPNAMSELEDKIKNLQKK